MHVFGDRSSKNEAPLLDSFFSNSGLGASLNYCAICLRTENERRMVNNSILVTFTNIIVLNKVWQHGSICYVCEKQAQKATRFIVGVSFAATIDTIFKEILIQKHILHKDVFQNVIFRSILEKFNLAGNKVLPRQWELDLKDVRNATEESTATPEAVPFTPRVVPVTPKFDTFTPQVSDSGNGKAKGKGKGKGKENRRLVAKQKPSSIDKPVWPPPRVKAEPSDSHLMPPPRPDIKPSTASLASQSRPNKDPDPATLATRKSGRTVDKFRSRLSHLMRYTNVFESREDKTRPRSFYNMRNADQTGGRGDQGSENRSAADQPDFSGAVEDGSDKGHDARVDKPGLNGTVDDSSDMGHDVDEGRPGLSGIVVDRNQTGQGGDVDHPGGSEEPRQVDTNSSSAKEDEENKDTVVLPPPQLDSETIADAVDKDVDVKMEEIAPRHIDEVDDAHTTDWEYEIPARVLSSMNAVTPRPDPIFTPVSSQVICPVPPAEMNRRPSIQRNAVTPRPDPIFTPVSSQVILPVPPAEMKRRPSILMNAVTPRRDPVITPVSSQVIRPVPPAEIQRNAVTPRPDPMFTPVSSQVIRPVPPAEMKRRPSILMVEDPSPSRVKTPETYKIVRLQRPADPNRQMITAVTTTTHTIQTPEARYRKMSTEQFRNTVPWMGNPGKMPRIKVEDPSPSRVMTPKTYKKVRLQNAEDRSPSRVMTPNTYQKLRSQVAVEPHPSRTPNTFQMKRPQNAEDPSPSRVMTLNTCQMHRSQGAVQIEDKPDMAQHFRVVYKPQSMDWKKGRDGQVQDAIKKFCL